MSLNLNISGMRGKTDFGEGRFLKTGQTAGKADIYYFSPKERSSTDVSGSVDLSTSFVDSQALPPKLVQNINPNISLYQTSSLKRKGAELHPSSPVSITSAKQQFIDYGRSVKSDASLVPPIRQTASIFKQPVTVHRNLPETKATRELKPATNDKPKQIFWEKRLEGLRACDSDGEEFSVVDLGKLKPIPPITEMTLQSVATALHLNSGPIAGQQASKATILSNPIAFIAPDQPMIYAVTITDEDIRKQEEKVNAARRKLQEALREI